MQHIPDIELITNYFSEGLRVLKPNGVLNFSIQVWMILRKGGIHGDRVGAQVRASDIETILNKTGHELVKIYSDPKDPVPHFNILIKKLDQKTSEYNIEARKTTPYRIREDMVENVDVRTGIFEDLASYGNHRKIWDKNNRRKVTFFRQSLGYFLLMRVVFLFRSRL